MEEKQIKYKVKKSLEKSRRKNINRHKWKIKLPEKEYVWETKLERVALIRKRIPYSSIEVISKSANLPVKSFLHLFGIPQTTYNQKKKRNDLLSGRDSEIVLVLTELLEYGKYVFNNESDKFHRWLKKPNISLGGVRPDSFFDSLTGIQVVRNILDKIEYGNFA